jgi:hypothetical protein
MSPKTNNNGLSLIPAAIVAVGPAEQPVERLIGLQSAIARAVDWLCDLRLPRLRNVPLHLHPNRQGDLS